MTDDILLIVQLAVPVGLLVLGFFAGRIAESRHYKSIHEREDRFLQTPALSRRTLDPAATVSSSAIAFGSVVISVDHYKRLLMALRKIFGGEIHAYSSLLDRGRREALLRMKESAPDADVYLNCRLETSTIFNGAGRATGSVEVLAYCTAVKLRK